MWNNTLKAFENTSVSMVLRIETMSETHLRFMRIFFQKIPENEGLHKSTE